MKRRLVACRSRRSKEVRLELDEENEKCSGEEERREKGATEVGEGDNRRDGNGDGGGVNHKAAAIYAVKNIPWMDRRKNIHIKQNSQT